MFVLHVDLAVRPGSQQDLEAVYRSIFCPAISGQEGFHDVGLLRPSEGDDQMYRLTIAFTNQDFQQRWVATDLHQQVWPQIERRCSEYSVRYYAPV